MSTKSCVLCVSDYWNTRSYWQLILSTACTNIKNSCSDRNSCCSLTKLSRLPAKKSSFIEGQRNLAQPLKASSYKRLYININAKSAGYLIREILESEAYRRHLLTTLPQIEQLDVIWLQITPANKPSIDFKWNKMVGHLLWEHIEMDTLMSWLSTLGGGFSALGEQFSKCAQTAGKISIKQLTIGLRIGDPFLQARCKLFYSLSLIQTGRLRTAKYIVRDQYAFARMHEEQDSRLVKMCLGIWLRIQYEYRMRRERRLAGGDTRKAIEQQ